MNIHINTKHLDFLINQSIYHCPIGSQLYETATQNSDTDILYIYTESFNELNNPFYNHHQFQIKTNGIDYIFTSIRQFVRNLIQGDSSINIDVLMLTNICEVIPAFNQLKVESATCYPVLKCLLGMAKRDLKLANNAKKLGHVTRGLYCYKWLREKGFYTQKDIQDLSKLNLSHTQLKVIEKELRTQLNNDYDADVLKKHLTLACQEKIIDYLQQVSRNQENPLLSYQLIANNNKAFYY